MALVAIDFARKSSKRQESISYPILSDMAMQYADSLGIESWRIRDPLWFVELWQARAKAEGTEVVRRLNKALRERRDDPLVGVLAAEWAFSAESRYEKTVALCDHVLRLDTAFGSALNYRGLAKLSIADSLKANGEDSLARARLRSAVDDFSRQIGLRSKAKHKAGAYGNRARAHRRMGDTRAAIENFVWSIDIDPTQAGTYFNLAVLLDSLGDYRRAAAYCSVALARDRNYAEAYNLRGEIRWVLRDTLGSVVDFNSAIVRDPRRAKYYFNRGVFYFNTGNFAKAESDFVRTYELDPAYAGARENLDSARVALRREIR